MSSAKFSTEVVEDRKIVVPQWFEPALWFATSMSIVGVLLFYTAAMGTHILLIMVLPAVLVFAGLGVYGRAQLGVKLNARTAMLSSLSISSFVHLVLVYILASGGVSGGGMIALSVVLTMFTIGVAAYFCWAFDSEEFDLAVLRTTTMVTWTKVLAIISMLTYASLVICLFIGGACDGVVGAVLGASLCCMISLVASSVSFWIYTSMQWRHQTNVMSQHDQPLSA